jgi:hypothetical protein
MSSKASLGSGENFDTQAGRLKSVWAVPSGAAFSYLGGFFLSPIGMTDHSCIQGRHVEHSRTILSLTMFPYLSARLFGFCRAVPVSVS